MVKQIKSKRTVPELTKNDRKIYKYLIAFPIIALAIKIIIMFNIPNGGWYGADGENYTAGVDGLLSSGFYSKESKLSYWPAGYPLLLWPLAEISVSKFYYLISFLQSIFYAYATFFLTRSVNKSSLKKFAFALSLVLCFNPTLSLSTLAVGYEAPIAACFMMILALFVDYGNYQVGRKFWLAIFSAASWFALAIFMQPRFTLVGALFFLIWAIKFGKIKLIASILLLCGTVMAIGPAVMIFRNIQVIEQATISTNLGVTMAIGAGDSTSGGYARSGPEVPCQPTPPASAPTDNQKVKCVLNWYLQNPLKTLKLSFNKSQYFWSPWSGPLANGTMARNPWLKIAPTQSIKKSQEGARFVFGIPGKVISYCWIIGQLIFLFWGYRELLKMGAFEKVVANMTLLPIVISWLISIGTIGDHRFRIPTMSLSLLLQVVGFMALRKKVSKGL
jgi:hypothetical protein